VLFAAPAGVWVAGATVFCAARFGVAWLYAYLVALSACTFVYYGYDKLAAKREWLRVPEIVLHAMALLGGSLAAWLGQRAFRHKTLKGPFRVVFWLIVLLQAAGVALWIRCA